VKEKINGWWKSVAKGREGVDDEIFFFQSSGGNTPKVEVRETLLSRRNRKGGEWIREERW